MRKYTKKVTTQKIEEVFESNDISKLYGKSFITSWNGKTSDTNEEYQEIFAEYIFHRLVDNVNMKEHTLKEITKKVFREITILAKEN